MKITKGMVIAAVISLCMGMAIGLYINAEKKEAKFDKGYTQHIRNAASAKTEIEAYAEAKAAVDFLEENNIQDVIVHHPEFADFYKQSTDFRDRLLDWSKHEFAFNGDTQDGVKDLLHQYKLAYFEVFSYKAIPIFPEKLQYQLYS